MPINYIRWNEAEANKGYVTHYNINKYNILDSRILLSKIVLP